MSAEFAFVLAVLAASSCFGAGPGRGFLRDGDRARGVLPGGTGDEFLTVEKTGSITAGLHGGGRVSWALAFWHDKGGYSAQGWAVPDKPLEVGPDGFVRVGGVFRASGRDIPVRYRQEVRPIAPAGGPGAWVVRYELEKTGDISLGRGVQLETRIGYADMRGRRVFLHPARFAALPAAMRSLADEVHYEVGPGRALRVSLGGLCHARTTAGGRDACMLYVRLGPDPPRAEKLTFELRVDFVDMPGSLPGHIPPGLHGGIGKPLALRGAKFSSRSVGRFEKLEIAARLDATYDNPFDPAEVTLDAVVTTPSERAVNLPGFYKVDHERRVVPEGELMVPTGRQGWYVRFTPTEVGRHTVRLNACDRSGEVALEAGSFDVTPSRRRGFVRVSEADPHYFAFDSGEPYFPVGHNLPIYHDTGQLGLEAIRKMADRGENYNRWWMCSYGFGIEWDDRLVRYRQDEAARIDLALDLADELGFYYMMCMDTHQDFRDRKGWEGWFLNPYNVALGGPCETPREWLTKPEARACYRKRLRYIVARWGYSPNVLCWEFGNEFEGWPGATNEEKLDWHVEMARHLKAIDPFAHLVTTSFWGKTGPPAFWRLPEIDIVQSHHYSNDDSSMAEAVADYSRSQAREFAKPHLFSEFGVASGSGTAERDPEGWFLHNALWAGTMSFCAGTPMPWWHESYIDPLDQYFHFAAVARFVEGLPMATANWRPLEYDELRFVKPPPARRTDVTIRPRAWWGKPKVNEFTVGRDGSITDVTILSGLLQGRAHKDIKNPPTFHVDYPARGQFIVHVGRVSSGGSLSIWLDERLVLERELPCGEGLGNTSKWVERWKLWETTYDEDVAIDVPAGRHVIRLDNDGRDWVQVVHYRLTGYQTVHKPKLLVLGMQTDRIALVWLHNRESAWTNHYEDGAIKPVPAATLTLTGLSSGVGGGPRAVEWWETWKGTRRRTERARVKNGRLTISLPELATDVALKILPVD